MINKNEKLFWFIKKLKTRSLDRFTFSNVSDGVLEIIKVQRKPPKTRIFQEDQLEEFKKSNTITSLDYINEKQMKSLGEGSFLKKNFYRSYHAALPYWRTFFSLTEALMWKFIIKELWCRCPLNYWWKGLSAWWSCFFNNRWFDKEHAWCIALHSSAKSERGLAGRRNSVEHGNVSAIWFHIKGFVYDNHMSATFLLTASCCDQIWEQFLTCRFQVTISIST